VEERTLKLKKYIEDISLIQEKNPFDLRSIEKCIKSYTLSDDEKDQLEKICLSHIKRSEELLRMKNLNGAIISIERAVEINPLSDELRNHAAQLYLMRANREGYKKSDRDLSYNSAVFSRNLKKPNPIANSILDEIRKKDNKATGKDLNKKLILPIVLLLVIVTAAVLWENDFTIPFLSTREVKNDKEWIPPPKMEKTIFTEQDISIQINSTLTEDFDIQLNKSLISKINGSYSYVIQGEIIAPESAVKSADLDINFINSSGGSLFKKSISLIGDDQIILPGESIIIDEFFYIHYLPPDIDHINFNLSNISLPDDFNSNTANRELYIQWNTSRPEGINISMILKNENAFDSYSGTFTNMKIELMNQGNGEIFNLDVALSWKDKYGNILLESPKNLIRLDNPPLSEGKNRIFYLFTELTEEISQKADEFYISINRIN